MIAGQLIKITGTKKLMVKITEQDYTKIKEQLTSEHNRLKFNTDRLATFTMENDFNHDDVPQLSYFCMISLDKYDKQLVARKFEPLVRKMIIFTFQMKPYDFTPNDSFDRKTGVNLQLAKIRLDVKKQAVIDVTIKEAKRRFMDSVDHDSEDELSSR